MELAVGRQSLESIYRMLWRIALGLWNELYHSIANGMNSVLMQIIDTNAKCQLYELFMTKQSKCETPKRSLRGQFLGLNATS
jgi:hypothetical protein